MHGGQKLDHVISAEEPLVTVETHQELGRDVAEEREHAGAVDELTCVVSVVRPHTYAKHDGTRVAGGAHRGTDDCGARGGFHELVARYDTTVQGRTTPLLRTRMTWYPDESDRRFDF